MARRLKPDVVVLDLGLPGFDGLEAARRLRAEPELNGLLLVALSGWVQPDDRARSREAGFDHHLAKPVQLRSLEGVLLEAWGDRGHTA
jgi:CheY-like chemotaxis protein